MPRPRTFPRPSTDLDWLLRKTCRSHIGRLFQEATKEDCSSKEQKTVDAPPEAVEKDWISIQGIGAINAVWYSPVDDFFNERLFLHDETEQVLATHYPSGILVADALLTIRVYRCIISFKYPASPGIKSSDTQAKSVSEKNSQRWPKSVMEDACKHILRQTHEIQFSLIAARVYKSAILLLCPGVHPLHAERISWDTVSHFIHPLLDPSIEDPKSTTDFSTVVLEKHSQARFPLLFTICETIESAFQGGTAEGEGGIPFLSARIFKQVARTYGVEDSIIVTEDAAAKMPWPSVIAREDSDDSLSKTSIASVEKFFHFLKLTVPQSDLGLPLAPPVPRKLVKPFRHNGVYDGVRHRESRRRMRLDRRDGPSPRPVSPIRETAWGDISMLDNRTVEAQLNESNLEPANPVETADTSFMKKPLRMYAFDIVPRPSSAPVRLAASIHKITKQLEEKEDNGTSKTEGTPVVKKSGKEVLTALIRSVHERTASRLPPKSSFNDADAPKTVDRIDTVPPVLRINKTLEPRCRAGSADRTRTRRPPQSYPFANHLGVVHLASTNNMAEAALAEIMRESEAAGLRRGPLLSDVAIEQRKTPSLIVPINPVSRLSQRLSDVGANQSRLTASAQVTTRPTTAMSTKRSQNPTAACLCSSAIGSRPLSASSFPLRKTKFYCPQSTSSLSGNGEELKKVPESSHHIDRSNDSDFANIVSERRMRPHLDERESCNLVFTGAPLELGSRQQWREYFEFIHLTSTPKLTDDDRRVLAKIFPQYCVPVRPVGESASRELREWD